MELSNLNIGDKVLVSGRHELSVGTVDRFTKTRVTVMLPNMLGQEFARHFNRRTGSEIGSGPWSMVVVRPFDQREWDDYQADQRRKRQIKFLREFNYSALNDEQLTAVRAILAQPNTDRSNA